MTEAEKIICRLYLEDMDKNHTCNEYRLLMELLDREPCEDAISRQAAIEALGEGAMFNYQAAGNDNGLIKAINVIKGLPSAEPQIIRCKECKHWTNNIGDSKLRDNYCNEAVHGFYYRCSGDDYCSFAERRTDEANT